jgi:hypothetical protein
MIIVTVPLLAGVPVGGLRYGRCNQNV